MKICMVVNNLNVGGLERVVVSLIGGVSRQGFDVHLVCLQGPGVLYQSLGLPSDRTLVLEKSATIRLGVCQVDPRVLMATRGFLRERQIEVVHAHNAAPLVYAGIATLGMRERPTVLYSEHNQIYSANALSRIKFRYYLRLADHVVTVSHDLLSTLNDAVGVRRPITVIHNGIDGSRFGTASGEGVRAEFGVKVGEIVVGTAAVLSEQKGIAFLLQAAQQLVHESPLIRFVVAGDGPLREALIEQARYAGLQDRVHFVGYRADMPELMASLDVYVMPSLWEGLPLALLEAMSSGKAIVASNVGGNAEVIAHGVNGLLVKPRDVAGLVRSIACLAKNGALRRQLGEAARRRFAEQFNEQVMIDRHVALYEEIARARQRNAESLLVRLERTAVDKTRRVT